MLCRARPSRSWARRSWACWASSPGASSGWTPPRRPPVPSDTLFTQAPEWSWLVILYFFCGGIAGGSYFIAALIDLFGSDLDRPLARLGYYVAFPAVVLCGPLLI